MEKPIPEVESSPPFMNRNSTPRTHCLHCGAEAPQCTGGCVPIALAAILAEVSRTRIYALMEREQLATTAFAGCRFVCVPSLMRYIAARSVRAGDQDAA